MRIGLKPQKPKYAPVKEDATDIIVAYRWFFGAGSHSERPQEAIDQDRKLMDVLCLSLHHVEDDLVSFPHALSMRRTNVVLHNNLPLPSTQPPSHEALDLQRESVSCISVSLG